MFPRHVSPWVPFTQFSNITCVCFEMHFEKSQMLHHTRTHSRMHASAPHRTSPVFQIVASDGWMAENKAAHICSTSQSQLDVQCLCIKTLTQLVLAGINYYLCTENTFPPLSLSLVQEEILAYKKNLLWGPCWLHHYLYFMLYFYIMLRPLLHTILALKP